VQDTIARRSDVLKSSVEMKVPAGSTGKYQPGTITFRAAEGQSIDLEKIHQSLKTTRLGGGTRSEVTFLEITATGEVMANGKEAQLKVAGTEQTFALAAAPVAAGEEGKRTPFELLQEAVTQGKKVKSVTGRVDGWKGVWPQVLKEVPGETLQEPGKPPTKRMKLLVTAFEAG